MSDTSERSDHRPLLADLIKEKLKREEALRQGRDRILLVLKRLFLHSEVVFYFP